MDKLEHNIKKAFVKNDVNVRFAGKEAMWNRLDVSLGSPKKVAAWWRVAAFFLGLLFAGSVFAGLKFRAQQHVQIEELEIQNAQLQEAVDSLLVLPAVVKIEMQTVEKIVYRDRIVQSIKADDDTNWKKKYLQLQDSSDQLFAGQKKNYESELARLNAELNAARTELSALQQMKQPTENEPFKLKSERVELGVQKKPAVSSPEMELKIFPRKAIEKTNDLNKTLFKNEP